MDRFVDLVLFTGAVYGLAWLLTKSRLFRRPRELISRAPFLGELLACIVCASAWVSLALVPLLPFTSLFSPAFRATTALDVGVLLAWSLFSTWAIGRALGDAD
ncbi:MAG: hypothetical protein ACOZNI_34860 [Myxococcota bacterium]